MAKKKPSKQAKGTKTDPIVAGASSPSELPSTVAGASSPSALPPKTTGAGSPSHGRARKAAEPASERPRPKPSEKTKAAPARPRKAAARKASPAKPTVRRAAASGKGKVETPKTEASRAEAALPQPHVAVEPVAAVVPEPASKVRRQKKPSTAAEAKQTASKPKAPKSKRVPPSTATKAKATRTAAKKIEAAAPAPAETVLPGRDRNGQLALFPATIEPVDRTDESPAAPPQEVGGGEAAAACLPDSPSAEPPAEPASDAMEPSASEPATSASATSESATKPVSVDREERVRLRAYFLWEQAGRPVSDGVSFWQAAQAEVEAEGLAEPGAIRA